MKKFSVIVIVISLSFLLSGCSLPNVGTSKITLTYWGLWEPENVIAPLISEYQSTHPNVKIVYSQQKSTDYRERLQNSLAKGEGPDIFRVHNTWAPMFRKELSSIPASIISTSEYESTFYPVTKNDLKLGNNYVAIPLEIDELALFYNLDLFRAAGISAPPKDWTGEFRDVAQKLTITSSDGRIQTSGAALGVVSNVDHWQEILGLMFSQTGVDFKNIQEDRSAEVLTFYTNFAKGYGKTWDETLPNSTEAFAQGKLAMYFAPSWRSFDLMALNPDLKFKIAPVPQLISADETKETFSSYASYWAEAVSLKSKNQKAAWEFLKFLSSKSSLSKLYTQQAQLRPFGEPYSRRDLASTIGENDLSSAFIKMAPETVSWYLASSTNDGTTGLNSKMGKYFEDAINSIIKNQTDPKETLVTLHKGINQVLGSYQLPTGAVINPK